MTEEVWKPIVGFEGIYEVSNYGRIKSLPREKRTKGQILKPYLNRYGYHVVSLRKEAKGKTYCLKVHRIVAQAFIENPNNYPYINHKDENKTNNNAENLEWCTPYYNTHYGSCIEKSASKRRGEPMPKMIGNQHGKGHRHTQEVIEKIRIATSLAKRVPVIAVDVITGSILEFERVNDCKKFFHISRLAEVIKKGLPYKGHNFYYAQEV